MDFKGASWVGNIYQKFEAMCLEVEETMYEDAVKFVESQVQNVGSNMKKFYTDVMQDLVSPDSTDHVKVPVADLPLDSYTDTKSDENIKQRKKEDTKKVGSLFTNDPKVIDEEDGDQVSSFQEYVKQRVDSYTRGSIKGSFSMQDSKGEQYEDRTVCCKNVPKKDCCHMYMKTTSKRLENQDGPSLVSEITQEYATTDHMVLASPQASVEVEGWEWDSTVEKEEMSSSKNFDGLFVDDFTVDGPISADVLASRTIGEVFAQDSIETDSSVKSCVLGDLISSQSIGGPVSLSDSGSFSNCDEDVIETNDSTVPKMETTNKDTLKLEETCVFVNEDNISFVSYKDGEPWSYKKKIREAFSLKKKSSRRQEYEKLVTQYEDANASSSLTCVETVTRTLSPESNTVELQTREFCDSDWELL